VRLRHEREPSPEITLTPLIDVVFLLLIFFMVSTTFERDAELLVELPQASSEAEPARQDTIEVVVDVQGRFYVGGHQLVNTQLDTVRRALEQAAEGLDEPQVVVSADAQTPHQAVVTVMDAARRAGLVRLTFAARLTEEAR
jgi:biopolymer transport protein ExbD